MLYVIISYVHFCVLLFYIIMLNRVSVISVSNVKVAEKRKELVINSV